MKLFIKSLILKSFTLIELLIVIVIIGVVSTALIPRIKSIQAQARDTRRLADVRAIQNALEMYYMDHGRYPSSNSCGAIVPNNHRCNSVETLSGGRWIANGALAPYLPGGDPVDPKGGSQAIFATNQKGTYFYYNIANSGCAGGQYYMLTMGMETQTAITYVGKLCNGTVYSAGGGNYRIVRIGSYK